MSADNCVAILVSPKSYKNPELEARVIETQAIDNIQYDDGTLVDTYNPRMLIDYFGKCKVLLVEEARARAFEMLQEEGIMEYGLLVFELKHPFSYYKKVAEVDKNVSKKVGKNVSKKVSKKVGKKVSKKVGRAKKVSEKEYIPACQMAGRIPLKR